MSLFKFYGVREPISVKLQLSSAPHFSQYLTHKIGFKRLTDSWSLSDEAQAHAFGVYPGDDHLQNGGFNGHALHLTGYLVAEL